MGMPKPRVPRQRRFSADVANSDSVDSTLFAVPTGKHIQIDYLWFGGAKNNTKIELLHVPPSGPAEIMAAGYGPSAGQIRPWRRNAPNGNVVLRLTNLAPSGSDVNIMAAWEGQEVDD
jgi:hypothetical protein